MNTKGLYKWESESCGVERSPHKKEDIKFSIVIPTLNQVSTLEDTLQSVIRQDYSNYELIIIDGGSTDGTIDLVMEYKEYVSYFKSEKDTGQSSAINKGFKKASGDIYAWINSDDFYLQGAFSNVASIFEKNRSIDVVVGAGEIVTKECVFLKHVKAMPMKRTNLLMWENDKWIMQQCCFWKSEVWKKSGGVDESLHLLMDYDLWLRYSNYANSCTTESVLAVMRYYPGAKTISEKKRVNEEIAYVYAKNNAYDKVRALVRRMEEEKTELARSIEKEKRRLSHRLFNRIGLGKI
jgi:glycosyltransferase involved in cell wall biosynthesis